MDFILEFFVSLIGELIVDGRKESWVPKPLRILSVCLSIVLIAFLIWYVKKVFK